MAEKIGYLDSLRGFAALVVVLDHFAISFYPALAGITTSYYAVGFEALIYGSPLCILLNGRFAVFVFFVLSGYVLTRKFFAGGDQAILRSSAIRRYFRLLPPVLLSLLLTAVVTLVFLKAIDAMYGITGIDYLLSYFDRPIDFVSIVRQAFWGSFFDRSPIYNIVLWTMSVEFFGSMLVFSLASLFGKTRNRWIFYLGAGLFLLNTYYLPFVMGMLLADIYSTSDRKSFAINNGVIIAFLLGAGLFLGSFTGLNSYSRFVFDLYPGLSQNMEMLFYSIGAFLLLLAILNSQVLKLLLSHRLFSFIGSISFSMYLTHMIVLATFTDLLCLLLINGLHLSYFASLVIAFPLTMVAVLGVACLTYRYVDLKGIRLSKAIYTTWFSEEKKPHVYDAVGKRILTATQKNVSRLLTYLGIYV